MQAVIKSVEAERAPVTAMIRDYGPQLEASYRAGQVLQGVPVGVENACYGGNILLSFIYDFGAIRGLLPVHETGAPVWPSYRGAGDMGPADLWSFLAMSNKHRNIVERRMIRVMEANCPLPFTIIHLDGGKAILSRKRSFEKLAARIQLVAGQEIPVTVLLTSSHGAWCEHRGLNVLVPRDEVYYGDVSPREMLEPGRSYMARVIERGEIIRASTRVLEPDPWESFSCRTGSVRRATIRGQLREGNNRFRVSFAPGISGVAQGAPLLTYHNNQVVNVRIVKIIPERRFILGRIEE